MRRSQAFPSQYLGKDDLESPLLVTIKEIDNAMVKGDHGDECKAVMFFKESGVKPLIMNNTNWMTLEDAYGEESDDWHGKPVELFVDPNVMYGGKRVGGVRVKTAPQPATESFGSAPTGEPTMTLDEAVGAVAVYGCNKDRLISLLKADGLTAWNPARDTPKVAKMIEDYKKIADAGYGSQPVVAGEQPTPVAEDDIPF